MGINRMMPFGYKIEYGHIVLHPDEAPWTEWIFGQYLSGASLREIAEQLNLQGVPYIADRPWNKNIVARILADQRYCGENGYPALVCCAQADAVAQRREKKAPTQRPTQLQRTIRTLAGRPITPAIEEQVLFLYQQVLAQPQLIQMPLESNREKPGIAEKQRQFNTLVNIHPLDETAAQELLRDICQMTYAQIYNADYETRCILHRFQAVESEKRIDAQLLRDTLSKIHVDSNGQVKLQFKNGRTYKQGQPM